MSYDIGYYYAPDPPDPPEPTEEDYCQMDGHFTEFLDHETGWQYCRCASVTIPVLPEPHNDYTARVEQLIDEYAGVLISRAPFRKRTHPEENDHHAVGAANIRREAGILLKTRSPEFLDALVSSARNSSPSSFSEHFSLNASDVELFAVLGRHLSNNAIMELRKLLGFLTEDSVRQWTFSPSKGLAEKISANSALLRDVQLAMELHSLLPNVRAYQVGKYPPAQAIFDVLPVLRESPEAVNAVAAVFVEQGITEAARDRVLSGVMGGDRMPSAPLVDGLL